MTEEQEKAIREEGLDVNITGVSTTPESAEIGTAEKKGESV
jgi:hypothetical protein